MIMIRCLQGKGDYSKILFKLFYVYKISVEFKPLLGKQREKKENEGS